MPLATPAHHALVDIRTLLEEARMPRSHAFAPEELPEICEEIALIVENYFARHGAEGGGA